MIAVTDDSEETQPQPTFDNRVYNFEDSSPHHPVGACPTCQRLTWLAIAQEYHADQPVICTCGRSASRLTTIKEALALNDRIAWSFASCDFVIWEHLDIPPRQVYRYEVWHAVEKWLGVEVLPQRNQPGVRFSPIVTPLEKVIFLSIEDSMRWIPDAESPPETVTVSWYRFGLRQIDSVPAWRQALFGASEMVDTYPSAALVLIASGFEAFFSETVRIRWQERGYRAGALKSIIKQGSIVNLVDWLPSILDMNSLTDMPDLYRQWKTIVNERRNDVLHRAQVHFTPEQARESLRCALDAITHVDPLALVRPHVYYSGE